jgi:hypothetical protein
MAARLEPTNPTCCGTTVAPVHAGSPESGQTLGLTEAFLSPRCD